MVSFTEVQSLESAWRRTLVCVLTISGVVISGGGAFVEWASAQSGLLDRWWYVDLVEGADVGSGRHDLVDAVEDVVGQSDVHSGDQVIELVHSASSEQGAADGGV
jgi:hypothetical protein